MVFLIVGLVLLALLILLIVLDRSHVFSSVRKRVVSWDERNRQALAPRNPWEEGYRREWK